VTQPQSKTKTRRNTATALTLACVVVAMTGLAFASVPLYRLFCQVTGYQGTTQRAERGSDTVLDREVVVRFDANVSGLAWNFRPEVPQIHVKLGETAMVNFIAENTGTTTATGTATFNVEPDASGAYFNKIQCFCFSEQTLAPGERIEMPVQFFVSPDFVEARELKTTRTLTLSYTFFPARDARQPVAQAGGDDKGKNL
jgi:cytochrome c oxidase assembly protein subunit 11